MSNSEDCYTSKRDTWFVVVVWFSVLVGAAAVVVLWCSEAPRSYQMPLTVGLTVVIALLLLTVYKTEYLLTADTLLIQCGLFRWKIPLAEIEEVLPTSSPLSSPACSLDRLKIVRNSAKPIMISPKKKEEFLEKVVSRTSHLVQEGERLVRK